MQAPEHARHGIVLLRDVLHDLPASLGTTLKLLGLSLLSALLLGASRSTTPTEPMPVLFEPQPRKGFARASRDRPAETAPKVRG